jgi:hypothetical protein
VPAPRETALLLPPRLTAIPRPDGRGGETKAVAVAVTARTFPAEAAVGLLSRDKSNLRGTLGGGAGAGALRALASEAAVGAKRPDDVVVGREARGAVLFLDDAAAAVAGVFGRAVGARGVGDLTVVRGSVDGALRVPGPFDGVRGVGVLLRLRRAVAVDGRAPVVDGVDCGGEGSFGGLDTAAAAATAGRDVEANDRALAAGTGAAIEAGAGVDRSLAGFASVAAVSGAVGVAGDVSGIGARCVVSTCPLTGRTSSEAGDDDVAIGAGVMIGFGGGMPLAAAAPDPLVLPFVLTGGHSRAMRCSSLAGSPALLEAALVAREGVPGVVGWRFCCCSKRPMRFATD